MIEDGFHPCRECGMPMVEEWSNVDGDYLRCTWCGFEREWLGGRKVLRHGNPEKIPGPTGKKSGGSAPHEGPKASPPSPAWGRSRSGLRKR